MPLSSPATTGAIALGIVFVFFVLSVLGWRYPSSIGSRFAIGVLLGVLAVGASVYVSDSVTQFVREMGLSPLVAELKQ